MFKSKELGDSQFLNNATLSTLNETCNGIPKITSTPLHSHASGPVRNRLFLSPSATKQGTPRRYSLSEASPSTSRQKPNVHNTHVSGPLLATLSFKDNVSMYEETKSSGLARRIVLYNDESEHERKMTHQEKYSSPGLFPIVNLFKKDPPILEQSPKRVKIKLSSPERLRSYSPQLVKSRIAEEVVKPRFRRQSSLPLYSQPNDVGTKSVLEALKEISRKRIHSNEEHDDEDTGKRIRTELQNGSVATAKRSRADSPLLDTSHSPTPKPSQKKFCVNDEFAASKSSSDFSFLAKPEPLRSKRKTISTSTESLVTPKHVKVVNVETQTFTTVTDSKAKSNKAETCEENSKKKECPLKVFDDAPLERIRKSRLAALMSNLAGKDAAIPVKPTDLDNKAKELWKPCEESNSKLDNEEDTTDICKPPVEEKAKEIVDQHNKSLISILSPPKSTREASPLKSDKHVQFNVTNANSLLTQPSLTQTSTSIITPIVSDSINVSSTTTKETSQVSDSAGATSSLVPSFSQVSSKSKATIGSNLLSINTNSNVSKPLQISASDTSSGTSSLSKSNTTSPKAGGFKFDLKSPTSSGSVVKSSAISFPTFQSSSAVGSTSSTTMSTISNPAMFSFNKLPDNKNDGSATFGPLNTSVVKSSSLYEPASGFGGLSKSQSFNFGSTTTTTTTTSDSKLQTSSTPGGFSFSSNMNTSKFGNLGSAISSVSNDAGSSSFTTTTTTASGGFGNATFSFGAKTNSAFGNGQNVSKAPSNFAFGDTPAIAATSSVFATTSTPTFGLSTTSSSTSNSTISGNSGAIVPSFGNQTVPAFGNNQIAKSSVFNTPSSTATTSVFGNIPTTTATGYNSSTPVFGSTMAATSSVFSTPSVSASVFGSVLTSTQSAFSPPSISASAFGAAPVTTASMFNMPSTTASVFGSAPTTTASVFGSAPTTTASVFGSAPTTTAASGFSTTSAGFGSSNISAFQSSATTTNSDFGNNQSVFSLNSNATPVFGAASKSSSGSSSNVFGATSQASTFGSNNTSSAFGVAAPAPSLFGSPPTTSNAPTFGSGGFSSPAVTAASNATGFGTSTFSFGSNKQAANPFGPTTTNASTFGTASAFSSTSGFGTSSAFGGTSSNTFGNTTSTSSTFGASSVPAFNQAENKPSFAFGATDTKTNSVFGSGTGNSAFGKPTSSQSGFGASASGFGSTNAGGFNAQQTNGSFNFGSNAPSSSAPFGFGAPASSTEPSKPSFNFTGAANVPSFGGNSTAPAFGAVTPSFGASAPSFAATGSPATGVFNIGSGSSANGRHRTQLRAKRRT